MIAKIIKYSFPFIILFVGLYVQYGATDPQSLALARAGCLIVLYGIILESLYVIRATNKGASSVGPVTILPSNTLREHFIIYDYLKMIPSHYGLIWVCIGTIIWGFGDLVK